MGIFGAILKGVGIGVGASVVGDWLSNYCEKRAERKAEEARIAEERRLEEERRRNTPCYFTGKVSQNEFCAIVKKVSKRMSRRLNVDYVNSTIVAATFYSQSGQSKWSFEIDFNDYGDVTGKYWWLSKCYCESCIPENFAEQIQEEIELHRSNN